MDKLITFDDVLIEPSFSTVSSRKEVNTVSCLNDEKTKLQLPIVAANMDTVCGPEMAETLISTGAMGCLHRFCTIEENVINFLKVKKHTNKAPWVSIGISDLEKQRLESLIDVGAEIVTIDVAHAAQMQVVNFYKYVKLKFPHVFLIVGNFGNKNSVEKFCNHLGYKPDAIKVGIGPGSGGTTRIKTGCGVPQISALISCNQTNIPMIADGGIRTSGDVAKALAAGARMVMLGGMIAGTKETPGNISIIEGKAYKIYRGSASKESYVDQGKDWSCAEGELFKTPYKGSVVEIIKDIDGGIRSALTYVGAVDLRQFREKAIFNLISNSSIKENYAHGK